MHVLGSLHRTGDFPDVSLILDLSYGIHFLLALHQPSTIVSWQAGQYRLTPGIGTSQIKGPTSCLKLPFPVDPQARAPPIPLIPHISIRAKSPEGG